MSDQKTKAGAPFWTTVMLAVSLFGYILSFGPACWITSRASAGGPAIATIYRPMTWGMSQAQSIFHVLSWYAEFGAAPGWMWTDLNWLDRLTLPDDRPQWIWTSAHLP